MPSDEVDRVIHGLYALKRDLESRTGEDGLKLVPPKVFHKGIRPRPTASVDTMPLGGILESRVTTHGLKKWTFRSDTEGTNNPVHGHPMAPRLRKGCCLE